MQFGALGVLWRSTFHVMRLAGGHSDKLGLRSLRGLGNSDEYNAALEQCAAYWPAPVKLHRQ